MPVYVNGVEQVVAHEATHVSGGVDDLDSALAIAAMADLANTRIWQGNGANRPVEVAMPAALTFTELAGQENHVVTATDIWEDWDLSGIIGVGAVLVLVGIGNRNGLSLIGARKNGTALIRSWQVDESTDTTNPELTFALLTECDANRVIDIFADDFDNLFQVLGYWS